MIHYLQKKPNELGYAKMASCFDTFVPISWGANISNLTLPLEGGKGEVNN